MIEIEDVTVEGQTFRAFTMHAACVDCGAPFNALQPLLPEENDTPETIQRQLAEHMFEIVLRRPYLHTHGNCPECSSTGGIKEVAH